MSHYEERAGPRHQEPARHAQHPAKDTDPRSVSKLAADADDLPFVYLIASPSARKSPRWQETRQAISGAIRGARPAEYRDLFTGPEDYRACWPEVAAELVGAIVIPMRRKGRLWVGPAALREARHVRELGKPVLIHGPRGFLRWQSVTIRETCDGGRFTAAEIVIAEPRP